MRRPAIAALFVAGLLASAERGDAQAVPFNWKNRTLIGASYLHFDIDRATLGAGMLAIHSTRLGDHEVQPDFIGGMYVGGGGVAFTLSLGFGPYVSTSDFMADVTVGPGMLVGPGFLPNLQAGFGMVVRAGASLGIRLGAQRQWYVFNQGGVNNIGAWILEAGITGLGQEK